MTDYLGSLRQFSVQTQNSLEDELESGHRIDHDISASVIILKEWTAKAGTDNFGQDPPNAVLSVYEPGQTDNTAVVVEITQPKVDGSDLVYNYKLIEGRLPSGGGPTSLFIDWIGVGGVGHGFHGFGVGLRGSGLR